MASYYSPDYIESRYFGLRQRDKLGGGGADWSRADPTLETGDVDEKLGKSAVGTDRWSKLVAESLPSVLMSLGGLMMTGALLNAVQTWDAFTNVSELFVLLPTLLGLKGNLEMNLASRLGTASSLGHLDLPASRTSLVVGNIALVQIQAACVAGIASIWSILLSFISNDYHFNSAANSALICASAILTATSASLSLGLGTCAVVIVCKLVNLDPDNIATPVASSLGDLITLMTFGGLSTLLYRYHESPLSIVLIVAVLSMLPVWTWITLHNEHVREVLKTGWSPLVASMLISTFAGMVLEQYLDSYIGLAILVPVMNGICGTFSCIYASRLSTSLHKSGSMKLDHAPFTLFTVNIFVQAMFLGIVWATNLGNTNISLLFAVMYMTVSVTVGMALLIVTRGLISVLWSMQLDPDNYAFSLITALGDVLGTIFLVLGFQIMVWSGEVHRLAKKE
ncbi:uncharacterized protein BJ171DRAFT_493916 [Polychytrium aggregatum]|uniref:uncharacterized protein n=1 Tax=Polychytrium aggregatum TaxID=110093 RepID=UPI0022FEBD05|nr:uncharacterized protein BJ171DRAFT_493916 [Polychytrium aggregatum]KAI9207216.1 hypothetical protein BJ171DRAFT_493916 [Polychytrium aggregatum]